MKTIKFLTIVGVILTLSLVSCKKNENDLVNKPTNENTLPQGYQSAAEEEERYDKSVTAAAYGLLQLSKTQEFKDYVNLKVDEQFDGDDNVLIKTISDFYLQQSINIVDDFSSSVNNFYNTPSSLSAYIEGAINGFSYFDETEYVQIYIPFKNQVNRSDNPIICINLNDDAILPGFRLDENNNIEFFDVTESMAQQNLIWVISVNERMSVSEVEYPQASNELDSIGASDSTINGDTALNDTVYLSLKSRPLIDANIAEIYVINKKDGWGSGKADIAVAWYGRVQSCGMISWRTYTDYQGSTLAGIEPIFKTRKIGNPNLSSWITWGMPLTGRFPNGLWDNFLGENTNLGVLFFESDNRRKSKKTWTFPSFDNVSCGYGNLTFISNENAYGAIYFENKYLNNANFQWYTQREIYLGGMSVRIKYKYVSS